MRSVLYFIPLWFILALIIPIAWTAVSAWRRYRNALTVACPEADQTALVQIDPRHAVARTLVGGRLRKLRSCSRWPEHAGCAQGCLLLVG